MKGESDAIAPLEFCRAELAAPLHMTEVVEDWCRDLNALAGRVFARDRDALRRVETGLSRSGDGYGLISAIQSATRQYTNESFSIWGDACMQMMKRQAELVEALTSGFGAWRALGFSPLQKLPGIEAPIGSFSAWLRACQGAIVHGAAPSPEGRATQSPIHQATDTGV